MNIPNFLGEVLVGLGTAVGVVITQAIREMVSNHKANRDGVCPKCGREHPPHLDSEPPSEFPPEERPTNKRGKKLSQPRIKVHR